jgi:SAM-dependent methyltransferase
MNELPSRIELNQGEDLQRRRRLLDRQEFAGPIMDITGREFEAVAEHAGVAYLRYSFTKGTAQETAFILDVLGLKPGMRLVDVGCGPGRHCHALARAGIEVVGLDISSAFLRAAGPGSWVRADARRLPFRPGSFDAAISLCQGGFGLLGGDDDAVVLGQMAESVKRGGRIVVSAFSSYFAVRHLEPGETFDAGSGVNHELAEVRDPSGQPAMFDLWTTCFTPRELRLMAAAAGITVRAIWSVGPGSYGDRRPDLDHPEFLLVGEV